MAGRCWSRFQLGERKWVRPAAMAVALCVVSCRTPTVYEVRYRDPSAVTATLAAAAPATGDLIDFPGFHQRGITALGPAKKRLA